MAPYIHHCIPKIKNYANQLEWVENNLNDGDSTEVFVENTLLDLEKPVDEGYFLQVPGESQVQEESEAPNLSKVPKKSDIPEQSKKTYKLEAAMSTPPVLQTPLNEEKILKRNREGATTSEKPTSQSYAETSWAKRQRVNPFSE